MPDDGFIDLLNPAGALTGSFPPILFSVDFTYLGSGPPGSQRFELYQSDPFNVVASGSTVGVQVVAEPEAFVLFGVGLMGLIVNARRRRLAPHGMPA